MKKPFNPTPEGTAPAARPHARREPDDPEVQALRDAIEELVDLSPEDFLSRLDLLRAGTDFERLLNCSRNVDMHLYADANARAESVAESYKDYTLEYNVASDGSCNHDWGADFFYLADSDIDIFEVRGRIKCFDASRGFGFITAEADDTEILLHITCLRASGYQTAHEGARVVCQAMRRPKGAQAFRIITMDESTAIHRPASGLRPTFFVAPESDWEQTIVKWFNLVRGFGFLTRGAGTPDIFVDMETLRRFGFAELRPGQIVFVRWGHGPKGRMAAQLAAERPPDPGTPLRG